MGLDYKISDHPSKYLEPVGNGNIDVVKDFQWTLTPPSARRNVPSVRVKEYQQTQGQLISSIIFYGRVLAGLDSLSDVISSPQDPSDIYKYKYIAKPTGFNYKFPYFNPQKVNRTTDFGYEDGQSPFAALGSVGSEIMKYGTQSDRKAGKGIGRRTVGFIGGTLPTITNALWGLGSSLVPGKLSLENPQSWNGTQGGSTDVTFDLFNTGTLEDVENNHRLCYLLTHNAGSPSRRNAAIVDPTCIYEVYIPSVCHYLASYVSSLNITNLGNTREIQISDGTKRIIPEAYRITMTFTDLFMPTRNILWGMENGERLTAIADSTNIDAFVKGLMQGLQSGDFTSITPKIISGVSLDTGVSEDTLRKQVENAQFSSFLTSTGGSIIDN